MRHSIEIHTFAKNCLENEEKKVFGKGNCADRYVVGLDNRAW